jgi:hypothetical protein
MMIKLEEINNYIISELWFFFSGPDHRNTHTAVECWDDEDDSESQLPDVADAPPGTALVGS